MKKIIYALVFGMFLSFGMSSCIVVEKKGNNGKKKGWLKNSNNPHHPNSTNPGKGHKKGKEKH